MGSSSISLRFPHLFRSTCISIHWYLPDRPGWDIFRAETDPNIPSISPLSSGSKTPTPATTLRPLLSLLSTHIQSTSPTTRDISLLSLTSLLSSSSARQLLWSLSLPASVEVGPQLSLIPTLIKLLQQNLNSGQSAPETQLQYLVVFCFWELTFEKRIAESIDKYGPFSRNPELPVWKSALIILDAFPFVPAVTLLTSSGNSLSSLSSPIWPSLRPKRRSSA